MERRAPLPGNRFRFRVRACRACGRGEAAWAGVRRFPPVARAGLANLSGVACGWQPGARVVPPVISGCF